MNQSQKFFPGFSIGVPDRILGYSFIEPRSVLVDMEVVYHQQPPRRRCWIVEAHHPRAVSVSLDQRALVEDDITNSALNCFQYPVSRVAKPHLGSHDSDTVGIATPIRQLTEEVRQPCHLWTPQDRCGATGHEMTGLSDRGVPSTPERTMIVTACRPIP